MKRIEMLRIVADTIYNNTFRTSMLETLPLAEKVLDAIEAAGMHPPGEPRPQADGYVEVDMPEWEEA